MNRSRATPNNTNTPATVPHDPDIGQILAAFPARQASLLPAMHAIQEHVGHVPASALAQIADALNISVSEVHAALQFYAYFNKQPPAELKIEICQAEACRAMQAEQLQKHITTFLDCPMGTQRPDGRVQVEKVYCLGLCSHGPALQINEKPYVRQNPQSFERIITELLP